LKQFQEAVGNTLELIGIGNNFLNRTQKAQHLREGKNKWDCIKLKSFSTTKETVPEPKDSSQNGRKSLLATHPIRDNIQNLDRTQKPSTPKESTPQ
jgi:hypothetical protein